MTGEIGSTIKSTHANVRNAAAILILLYCKRTDAVAALLAVSSSY